MWNRPINQFTGDESAGRFETDAHPGRRLGWLFVMLLFPAVVIAGRLAYLQGVVSIGYLDERDTTTVGYEWIPARDGRILSADGRVLAEDDVRYELLVHYRWLESPPDAGWLRRRALSRLPKTDRRKRDRVQAAEAEVLAERDTVWKRLRGLTGQSSDELTKLRGGIQTRVEKMIRSVQRRRNQRQQGMKDEDESLDAPRSASDVWDVVVDAVTTPPKRGHAEPVVLPEESDYHSLIGGLSIEASAEIEANPELYPGVRIRIAGRRTYPANSLAAHVIGHRTTYEDKTTRHIEIAGETVTLPALQTTVGKTGLEKSYDSLLRGQPGIRRVVRNNRGEILKTEVLQKPQSGRDVVINLEAGIQSRVEKLLDSSLKKAPPSTVPRGGSIVVLDVQTGAVLAAASAPRFDLNLFTQPNGDEWRRLSADRRQPFFPRSHRMVLPPGSVFKAVSSVAVLDSRQIDPEQRFACRGYLDRPDRHRCFIYRHFGVGHGPLNLADAICRSCNVYFYNAARKIGPKPLVDWAGRFGFGSPSGLDLPGERGGNVPAPTRRRWYPGDTLGLAIGQSRLTATPMQIARMMAAIANGGYLVTPHLMQRVGSATHASNAESPGTPFPRMRIPGLSEDVLRRVQTGLRMVVQHPRGTGYKHARLTDIEYAGKTGTAEVGGNKPDHAWFAGYAPAKNPRIAFAIVLEHAGSGGRQAGPVAKELVKLLLESRVIHSRVAAK